MSDEKIKKPIRCNCNLFDGSGTAVTDSWRVLRMMGEMIESFDSLSNLDRMMVAVFGSARTLPDSDEYKSAYRCGELLTKEGYGVITGGGPGIMEAACRGAFDAGGKTIGLNIRLPMEQTPNPYQTQSLYFRYFFLRKLAFLKYSSAIIVYPGGYGTIDEFSEVLTMAQTQKINLIPVIFVGKKFWKGFADWLNRSVLASKKIDEEDLLICHLVDTAEEAVAYLSECHRYGRYGTTLQ